MQNFIQTYAARACLTVLGLTLLTNTAFGYKDDTKVSYLDSVSSSYLYNKADSTSSILDQNSVDASAIEASFKLDSRPVITNSKAKIKLSLRDSDVKQALRMLADRAGVNIVFDKSVDGKITLDLNNIDINDAFMVIFKTMQYTYILDNNTLTVMSLDAFKSLGYVRQNMTVLPIKYVSADNVASFLNDNLFSSNIFGLSNRPIVTSNPSTNQIVVFGSNSDVMAIKRILPVIDTKPQINTFTVNHTTPKEMANLICDSLFYNSGSASNSKGGGGSGLDGDEIVLGGGTIACRDGGEGATGGSESGLSAFKTNPLTITYFPEQGKISTYGGSVEQVQVIRDFIKAHDKKQLMAYIELSVIELNESGSKEFDNAWNLWTPFLSLGFTAGEFGTYSRNPLNGAAGPGVMYMWGDRAYKHSSTITHNDEGRQLTNNSALTYKLRYIIEQGNGRVLTNPKIMVVNGRKATIDMTSDYIKSVTSQVVQNDGINATTQKTYDIGSDDGLKIEIVPFISPDGYISMNITPEFATIKERVTAQNEQGVDEIQATLLQRRDLELKNIRVRDSETLVLAGLIKENEQQNTKKMPILSDLPFIGSFFRNSYNSKTKEELVIVVTPHIIKDDESVDSNVYNL